MMQMRACRTKSRSTARNRKMTTGVSTAMVSTNAANQVSTGKNTAPLDAAGLGTRCHAKVGRQEPNPTRDPHARGADRQLRGCGSVESDAVGHDQAVGPARTRLRAVRLRSLTAMI